MEQFFPDDSIREYFTLQLAKTFIGGNPNKVMFFWTGVGNNGKTVLQSWVEHLFGDFTKKVNNSLLTGTPLAFGAPNAELSQCGGGVRMIVMEEPNEGSVINTGTMKGLSGNDTFKARDLYQSGKDMSLIRPMFVMHMICNRLPKIDTNDQAVWNRIRVIPFDSVFVDDIENYTEEEKARQCIYPMVDNINKELEGLVEALAWYLIHILKERHHLRTSVPGRVMTATNAYKNSSDFVYKFIAREVYVGQVTETLSSFGKLDPRISFSVERCINENEFVTEQTLFTE